jgi:hypothetical protein
MEPPSWLKAELVKMWPAECEACHHVRGTDPAQMTADEAGARARSADQRAAGMAAISSIAASFALSGAAVVVDTGKLIAPSLARYAFEYCLFLALISFVVAAGFAVKGHRKGAGTPASAAMAKTKHDHVTKSMVSLLIGMVFIAVMVVAAMNVTPPPPCPTSAAMSGAAPNQ